MAWRQQLSAEIEGWIVGRGEGDADERGGEAEDRGLPPTWVQNDRILAVGAVA